MSGTAKLTIDTFLETVKAHHLWGPQDALLVGISGGPDSVALAHLAYRTGQLAGLAHVNYHLRGEDSNQDEQLVRQFAEQWDVPVFVYPSSPEELAKDSALSLQMAAREVRYTWWAELIDSGNGTCLLTGHQADDQIETILLHWLRGTGLAGWSGIPLRREVFCRPLLPFSRSEILHYLQHEGLPYRLDFSNETKTYRRNQIRHQILPELLDIQPALHTLVYQQSQDAEGAIAAADAAVDQLADKAVRVVGQTWLFDINALQSVSWASYAWFRWLHPKGFSRDQLQTIARLTQDDHGQYFISDDWECVVNRGQLVCQPVSSVEGAESQILGPKDKVIERLEGVLTIKQVDHFSPSGPGDQHRMIIDAARIKYPLTLRKWQAGDRIQPQGMSGSKKVKDILIDAKSDRFEKEKTLVLAQGQDVIWLIGYRLSRHVQPGPDTQAFLELIWQSKEASS